MGRDEQLEVGGRRVARGDNVWTRALFWRAVWGSLSKQRLDQEAGYEGRARLLVVRRARRNWRCMTPGCGRQIARGQLYGSSTFGRYCPDCITPEEPKVEFRSDWPSSTSR